MFDVSQTYYDKTTLPFIIKSFVMRITKKELEARAAKAQFDNSLPDPNGNNMLFGQRQECIKPTLLNSMREKLGYNPKYASIFNQCQAKRF